MKTLKTAATALLLGSWLLGCQSDGAENATVQQAFTAHFGPVKPVRWTHNADYSYAHFTQKGNSVVAVFGNDGQLIDTEPAKPIQ